MVVSKLFITAVLSICHQSCLSMDTQQSY